MLKSKVSKLVRAGQNDVIEHCVETGEPLGNYAQNKVSKPVRAGQNDVINRALCGDRGTIGKLCAKARYANPSELGKMTS